LTTASCSVCSRAPDATSHTIIFLSAPPLIRTSLPLSRAHTIALTKSVWPRYLRPGSRETRSHDQMTLSQLPAKTVLLDGPPTVTQLTGAEGPRYTAVLSPFCVNALRLVHNVWKWVALGKLRLRAASQAGQIPQTRQPTRPTREIEGRLWLQESWI